MVLCVVRGAAVHDMVTKNWHWLRFIDLSRLLLTHLSVNQQCIKKYKKRPSVEDSKKQFATRFKMTVGVMGGGLKGVCVCVGLGGWGRCRSHSGVRL